MKPLPTGLQVFENIRKKGALYVDKTDMVYEIVSGARMQFFLSRPRRFGKSLLCWTLDALFSGKKELFEGLAISKTDWEWESYPVIHLDMSKVNTTDGSAGVKKSLADQTGDIADTHGLDLRGETEPGRMLELIIIKTAKKYGKPAVVIVDEYDKPFLDFYNKPPMAQEVRDIMRSYYSQFKANEPSMRFLFMTGISKFTKAGVFSTLNNLNDISLDEKFGTLLGYTEEELVDYFSEYLESGAKKLNMSPDELVEKLRANYNGFCFDGTQTVYCPFSVLNFFGNYRLLNYWIDSANPKIIADFMKDKRLTVEQFREFPISMDFAFRPGEIESSPPESFLYQAGYLTIRKGAGNDFKLDYPNAEVLNSMSELVYKNMTQRDGNFLDLRSPLVRALENGNCELFIETLNRLLSSILYDDYNNAAKQAIAQTGIKITTQEWLYRSTILAFLHGCDVLAFGEMHGSKGRSDLIVSYAGTTFVIEFKVARNDDCDTLAAEALKQISGKQYAAPYANAKKIGLAIDDKMRQVGAWVEG
ncbi:MAG: ATP-binding protein [Chitinispirillales bacterium]|jgi:hypothetical protein|nr:ATP-binding protein [Chitinispirillales bacterium]